MNDLLKPRYLVAADYPCTSFIVGSIWNEDEMICHATLIDETYPEKFPHLFRKLKWWEHRKPEEMPEYVKFYAPLPQRFIIGKISDWGIVGKCCIVKSDTDISYRELSKLDLPATKEEYDLYQQSHKIKT